ncbi:MAG: acyl carrier protein [Lachnospiraceae bacterium]|nr:acyl carrier protein [Lachnospiraceae bacterium]
MEELLELLEDFKDDVDWDAEDLVDSKQLNSLDVLQIISIINEEYDITVTAAEIIPENFNSVKSLWAMIERLQED